MSCIVGKTCLSYYIGSQSLGLDETHRHHRRRPWREAVTYRETWPHEYVLLQKDGERELMQAVCQRMLDGEAFRGPHRQGYRT